MNYFKPDELKCRCGCGFDVTPEFKGRLNKLRRMAGVPFSISSGARCVARNEAEGGSPDSAHTRGLAVDIRYRNSAHAFAIESACYAGGIKRIGRNRKLKFIHIDIDESLPQRVSFDY